MICCEGWIYENDEIDGECPDCGMPTSVGHAKEGCDWSPVVCATCGYAPCDESCLGGVNEN